MFGFSKNRSPQDRIRKADASTQRLRAKRERLDPFDEKKKNKINGKIHRNNVEIDIAKREMQQPKVEIDNSSRSVNFNKTINNSGVHLHGHYHSNNSKKK